MERVCLIKSQEEKNYNKTKQFNEFEYQPTTIALGKRYVLVCTKKETNA